MYRAIYKFHQLPSVSHQSCTKVRFLSFYGTSHRLDFIPSLSIIVIMADTKEDPVAAPPAYQAENVQEKHVDTAVQIAHDVTETKYSPRSKNMIMLYAVLCIPYLCGCLNGYDGSLMGGLNAMESYMKYFHKEVVDDSTGIIFAMYNIGSVAAVFFTGPVNDYFGRRWGMFTGALIIIIGTCIQAPSKTEGQFLAGRFVLGFGVSFCAVSAPTYVSEMAHPHWRGTITGF